MRFVSFAMAVAMLQCAAPAPKPHIRTGKDGLAYVWIPAGTSVIGCVTGDRQCFHWEKPAHAVTFRKGFWIGQTEVTQAAYERVMGKNPSLYQNPGRPVERLSWNAARDYCAKIGMRLPSADEWEYAAGGASGVGWFDGNSGDRTHPAGRLKPNKYGLYDMLGNVWEWVDDGFSDAFQSFKVLKGGSFVNAARELRPSNFLWATPGTAHRNMGVRCAGS